MCRYTDCTGCSDCETRKPCQVCDTHVGDLDACPGCGSLRCVMCSAFADDAVVTDGGAVCGACLGDIEAADGEERAAVEGRAP
jgi:hypothetical protein